VVRPVILRGPKGDGPILGGNDSDARGDRLVPSDFLDRFL
jgi:hypothetical protein